MTQALIQSYYDAFNRHSMEDFFALLSDDVVHEINQGDQEIGKKPFRKFMEMAFDCCEEKVVDLVIFTQGRHRAAAEFFVEGCYLKTVSGLPEARGQTYRLRCGAFFEIDGGLISRVTTYYNMKDWLAQVEAFEMDRPLI